MTASSQVQGGERHPEPDAVVKRGQILTRERLDLLQAILETVSVNYQFGCCRLRRAARRKVRTERLYQCSVMVFVIVQQRLESRASHVFNRSVGAAEEEARNAETFGGVNAPSDLKGAACFVEADPDCTGTRVWLTDAHACVRAETVQLTTKLICERCGIAVAGDKRDDAVVHESCPDLVISLIEQGVKTPWHAAQFLRVSIDAPHEDADRRRDIDSVSTQLATDLRPCDDTVHDVIKHLAEKLAPPGQDRLASRELQPDQSGDERRNRRGCT